MPSVLWRCWLGGRKGNRPVKKTEWWGVGMVICLEQGADLHMAQPMPLPLTVSCFSKIQIGSPFSYRLTQVVAVSACVWEQKTTPPRGQIINLPHLQSKDAVFSRDRLCCQSRRRRAAMRPRSHQVPFCLTPAAWWRSAELAGQTDTRPLTPGWRAMPANHQEPGGWHRSPRLEHRSLMPSMDQSCVENLKPFTTTQS